MTNDAESPRREGRTANGSAEIPPALAIVIQRLTEVHKANARRPIVGPDVRGVFPSAVVGSAMPIVVDANVLFQDIAYSAHHSARPTTLVNAANSGLVRLYMARNVRNELDKYRHTKPPTSTVDADTWMQTWHSNYRPLIRMIDESPRALLSSSERGRIDTLSDRDPDDVPSAELAIVLGAFFLSEDQDANRAVYGDHSDRPERTQWRDQLRAGSDAAALAQLGNGMKGTAKLLWMGGAALLGPILRSADSKVAAGLSAALIGGLAITSVNADLRAKLISAATTVAAEIAAGVNLYNLDSAIVRTLTPPDTNEEAVLAEIGPQGALTRSAMRLMVRRRDSTATAATLSHELAWSPIPHGESAVRAALRTAPQFDEISRGQWQLGELGKPFEYRDV